MCTKDLEIAYVEQPEGRFCGFCGNQNRWADDCGFWYLSPDEEHKHLPACEDCYRGEPGIKHRLNHGIGER